MAENRITSEDELWPLIDQLDEGVLLVGANPRRVLRANQTAARWLGKTPDELIGVSIKEVFLEEFSETLLARFENELAGESTDAAILAKLSPTERRNRLVGVKTCRIEWRGETVLGVRLLSVSDSGRNIDWATPGILWKDRASLEKRLRTLLHDYEPAKRNFALLFVDLDNFKSINDRFGHLGGDRVLNATASRLAECLGKDEYVARYVGDEFLVLAENETDTQRVDAIAERIRNSISQPIAMPGGPINVTASVGIAYASPEYRVVDDVLAAADRAMYAAKPGSV